MKKNELMTIDELSLSATELSKKNISDDKRYSSEITPRRIRDYIAKGLLDKPLKEGKTPLFTQSHLNKLLKLREMQSEGLSEQYIKKLSDNYFENNENNENNPHDEKLKNEAMAAINALQTHETNNIFYQSNNTNLNNVDLNIKSLINSTPYNEINKISKLNGITGMNQTSKIWQEFPVDEEGKVFLKIEYGSLPKNSEQILQNIKDLLNIK